MYLHVIDSLLAGLEDRPDDAVREAEAARHLGLALFGSRSPVHAWRTLNLAEAHLVASGLDAARTLCEEAIELLSRTHGADHPIFARAQAVRGTLRATCGELDAARSDLTSALAVYEAVGHAHAHHVRTSLEDVRLRAERGG